jgi:hypothetical protein
MEKTLDAINQGFVKKEGYYSFEFGDGYELCLEQLIFDEQWYLALYQHQSLLIPKVVVKLGK